MKLIRGIITACAVVTVSSAVAISASATKTADLTATYDKAAGTVTISDIDSTYYGEISNQCSYLVLNANNTTVAAADIVQIDQVDKATSISVPVGTLADGPYYVRVGGASSGYAAGSFTVESTTTVATGHDDNCNAGVYNATALTGNPYTVANGDTTDVSYAWYKDVTADGSYNRVSWAITNDPSGTKKTMGIENIPVTETTGDGTLRYAIAVTWKGDTERPIDPTAQVKFSQSN